MSRQVWVLDHSHSEVSFKVKHLMITTITGYFRKFSLQVETESDNINQIKTIEFAAEIDSIDTNDIQRDTHLKSDDFFDVENNKLLKFSATDYQCIETQQQLKGNITIGEVTKAIDLHVDFGGLVIDEYGRTKAGFTVSGKLSRKDFGLIWNAVTEAGNVVVSDEVKINADIQIIKDTNANNKK